MKAKQHARVTYLIAATIGLLFAGIIYAWSILKAPLAKEFGWTASALALNFTLTMCFFCIGGIVSGLLLKKISPKLILIASAVLVCLGFVLTSQLSGNILPLYFYYGVMCGTGIGMTYNAIISATNAWFPDKKGLSSGVQMMAFGASSLILGNAAGMLIDMPGFGWRATFMALGIAAGVVLLIAAFIIRFPDKNTVLPKPKDAGKKSAGDAEPKNYTTLEMIKRFSFWRFFLFQISLAAVGNTVISLARDLALSVGASAVIATTLVGVLSVCNGLGRLIAGALFDAVGRKRTMVIGNIITFVAPVTILGAIFTSSLPICITGLCLCGISYGFSPPISSAFMIAFYGPKDFAMNFSVVNTMLIPTSFIATFAGSMITKTGSYVSTFVMLIAMSVVSLFLNLSIRRP